MHNSTLPAEDHALDLEGVCELTTLARPTVNRGIANGTFPIPQKFGRKNIWMRSTVIAWLRNLPIKQSGKKAAA